MDNNKINIFAMCSLDYGKDNKFREQMHTLGNLLKLDTNIEFNGVKVQTYLVDKNDDIKRYNAFEKSVLECRLFVAIADMPSTELGLILAVANNAHKPSLLCFRKGTAIEDIQYITGSRGKNPHLEVIEYTNAEELANLILEKAQSMK